MASSFFATSRLRINGPDHFPKLKVQLRRPPPPCRSSQSVGDEGNSWDRVEAGMDVLRYRMQQLRIKERLNTSHENLAHGWNYRYQNDVVRKKHNLLSMSIELTSIVFTTFGLVFLSGSLCIFLVSLIFKCN